jgi:hypothetical protein
MRGEVVSDSTLRTRGVVAPGNRAGPGCGSTRPLPARWVRRYFGGSVFAGSANSRSA